VSADAARTRLEALIGHTFADPSLLDRALVHSSLASDAAGSNNETLEFLGDAVISLAVSEMLMERHPRHD
jgi:ribonuclease-3